MPRQARTRAPQAWACNEYKRNTNKQPLNHSDAPQRCRTPDARAAQCTFSALTSGHTAAEVACSARADLQSTEQEQARSTHSLPLSLLSRSATGRTSTGKVNWGVSIGKVHCPHACNGQNRLAHTSSRTHRRRHCCLTPPRELHD